MKNILQIIMIISTLLLPVTNCFALAPTIVLGEPSPAQKDTTPEIQLGKPQKWAIDPRILRHTVMIQHKNRGGKGELLTIPIGTTNITQDIINEGVFYNFSKHSLKPDASNHKPCPGKRIQEYIEESPQKAELLIVSNSLETSYFMPNGFIITKGEAIIKPPGHGLFDTQSQLNGEYRVFVLDKEQTGINKVTIKNGAWIKNTANTNIQEAIFTIPLLENGKDISHLVNVHQKPAKGPNDVLWGLDRNCAVSMIGTDNTNIFLLHIIEKMNNSQEITIPDALAIMKKVGCKDVGLMGLSADVHRYMKNEPIFEANARQGSMTGNQKGGKLRGIVTFLLFTKTLHTHI